MESVCCKYSAEYPELFPHRDILSDDPNYWTRVLEDFIQYIATTDRMLTFQQQLLRFIAMIHDTYANLWSSLTARPPVAPCELPVTESVSVDATATMVETTSGQVGATIQSSYVLEMPLADRNVFTLVNLVLGAFYKGNDISLGGGRTRSAQVLVDGVTSSRCGVAAQQIDLTPPVDSMQEFKVEVDAMGAENGRSSAGAVNAVTKSGSNKLTGSCYEFLRNNAFDASGCNNDQKPPLRRNNFGATGGGPVRRNRTFFFCNYDGLREQQGVSVTRSVGLPEWRTGNFSSATRDAGGRAVVVPIYDPETGSGNFGNPRNRSGAPFGVTVLNGPRDILGDQADGKNLRPDILGDPASGVNRGDPAPNIRGFYCFNPAAFAAPARFTHGNVARTLPGILGPGNINFDSLLAKNFSITERWRAQFRWETFNSFNTPEFDLPNNTLGGGGFGFVTGASSRRIMQLGLNCTGESYHSERFVTRERQLTPATRYARNPR